MEHQIVRILSETRWRGVMLWVNSSLDGERQYTGCLVGADLHPNYDTQPDTRRSTVEEVLDDLLGTALMTDD